MQVQVRTTTDGPYKKRVNPKSNRLGSRKGDIQCFFPSSLTYPLHLEPDWKPLLQSIGGGQGEVVRKGDLARRLVDHPSGGPHTPPQKNNQLSGTDSVEGWDEQF